MNESISFAASQDLGRYLQSLDSVRFAESDPDASIIHARIETIVSLLFGQTIPIGEHQFLDSAGFFSGSVELIESLDALDHKDRLKVENIFPFRLGIRQTYSTIDNLIAEKLGDVGYKLSLWQGIGQVNNQEMQVVRQEIKKKYLRGEFRFEQDDLVPLEDKKAAENLRIIRDHFKAGEQGKILSLYKTPTVVFAGYIGLLPAGLNQIVQITEDDLYQQVELQEQIRNSGFEIKEVFDADLISPAMELIELLKALQKTGVSFENRSNIRINPKSREIVSEDNKYNGILEIYDSLYNSSIAKAVEAHSEGVSSSRNIQDNIYIKAALALTTLAKNMVTSSGRMSSLSNRGILHWVHDTNFSLVEEAKAKVVLARMPWEEVWYAYLNPEWQKSVSTLNNALVEWDQLMMAPTSKIEEFQNTSMKLDDAISNHAEVVAKIVSKSDWKIYKNSDSGELVMQNVPTVVAAAAATPTAFFVMSSLGFDATTAGVASAAIGGMTGVLANLALPQTTMWQTKGYMRKIFEKIYNPKP